MRFDRGRCWIRVNDGAAVELRDDDFAVLSHGDPHEVIDDPRTPAVPLPSCLRGFRGSIWIVEIGKDGSLSHIICAGFACTLGAPLPLMTFLPRLRPSSVVVPDAVATTILSAY